MNFHKPSNALLLFLSLAVVAGCSIPQYAWVKPGASAQETAIAKAECEQEALVAKAENRKSVTGSVSQSTTQVSIGSEGSPDSVDTLKSGQEAHEDALAEDEDKWVISCMEIKGFVYQQVGTTSP